MASTPEAKVKAAVRRILNAHNAYHFSPVTYGMGRSGVPDILVCINGRFLGIECKTVGNKPTPLQYREIEKIREAGGTAIWVDETTVDDLPDLLRVLRGDEI